MDPDATTEEHPTGHTEEHPTGHRTDASTGSGAVIRRLMASLRFRVVVGYVLLLALALGASVLVTRQVLLARLDREIDAALEQEVEKLRRVAAGTNPETGEPFGMDAAAIFDTFLRSSVPGEGEAFYTIIAGEPFASSAGAPATLFEDDALVAHWSALTDAEVSRVDTDVGEARVLATPVRVADVDLGTFVVAIFPADARDDVLQSVRTILVIAGIVLVISSVVAWTAAGRILRPVRDLTDTARTITVRELTSRIPVTGRDEISELAATFNAMLDRLEGAFRFQREFMDDVAHELRTPITIVRGHLEILGEDPTEREETVEMLIEELDRMNRTVNDLLVLAKIERPDCREPCQRGQPRQRRQLVSVRQCLRAGAADGEEPVWSRVAPLPARAAPGSRRGCSVHDAGVLGQRDGSSRSSSSSSARRSSASSSTGSR